MDADEHGLYLRLSAFIGGSYSSSLVAIRGEEVR